MSLEIKDEQLEVTREWVGNDIEQRVGERVIAIPDVDGDGVTNRDEFKELLKGD